MSWVVRLVAVPAQLALIAAREASLLSLVASVTSTKVALAAARLLGANLQPFEEALQSNLPSTDQTSTGFSREAVAQALEAVLMERAKATPRSAPAPPENRVGQPPPSVLVGAGVDDGEVSGQENGQEGQGQ